MVRIHPGSQSKQEHHHLNDIIKMVVNTFLANVMETAFIPGRGAKGGKSSGKLGRANRN